MNHTRHLVSPVLLGILALGCSDSRALPEERGAQASMLEKLEAGTGVRWQMSRDEDTGFARHVFGGRTKALISAGASAATATFAFLSEYPELFGIKHPDVELVPVRGGQWRDELGQTHVRFQQVVNGVPVWGGELSSHFDQTGALNYVANNYVPRATPVDTRATLSPTQALSRALAEFSSTHPGFSDALLWRAPEVTLVIFPAEAGDALLAYHVQLFVDGTAAFQPANMNYMIGAAVGNVALRFNTLHSLGEIYGGAPSPAVTPAERISAFRPADVEATSVGESGKTRKFMVQDDGGSFSMIDNTRPKGKVRTANVTANATVTSANKDSGWEKAAVDAHYNAEVTYDYYKSVHNRDSIDGSGGPVISVVHASGLFDNANWSGTTMNYGDGQKVFVGSMAKALDVAAHEMTHGVTDAESGLAYRGEAGGLNESMSDIFGCLSEFAATKDAAKSMVMGEDVMPQGSKPMRSMSDPKNGGILTSSGIPQIDQASEMNSGLDPHVSSGVANSAFNLMTIGGKQPTSKVVVAAGLGWEKSGKLWYKTQTGGVLMSNSGFKDAQKANMKAASDLGFSQNEQNIIECAWIAVGVPAGATCKPIDGTTGGAGGGSGTGGAAGTGGTGTGGVAGAGGKAGSGGTAGTGGKAGSGGTAGTGGGTAGTGGGTAGTGGGTAGTGGGTAGTGGKAGSGGTAGTGGGTAGTGGKAGSGGTAGSGGGTAGTGGSSGASSGGSAGTSNGGKGGSTGGNTTGGSAGSGGDTDSGCGCSVPGAANVNGAGGFLAALGAIVSLARNRRRRAH